MDRTVAIANLHRLLEQKSQRPAEDLQNVTDSRAACIAVPFFTRAGSSSNHLKMQSFLSQEHLSRNYESSQPLLSTAERNLFEVLSGSEMRALCRLLSEHFIENNTPPAIAQHVRLNLPASIYILGLPARNVGRVMFGDAVVMKDWGLKLM